MMSEHSPTRTEPDRVHRTLEALRMIVTVWRPYYGRLGFGLLLSALALLSGFALMWNAGASVSALALGAGTSFGLLRVFGGARIVLRYAERLFAHDAMFRALAALRVWFFRRLAQGAAAGLGFRRAGDLLNRLVGDVELLDNLYLRIAVPFLAALISLPVLVIVAGLADWRLGLALGGLFLAAACLLPLLSALRSSGLSHTVLHAESALRVAALDLATGLREARAFSGELRLAGRIIEDETRLHEAQLQRNRAMAVSGALSYLCGQTALVILLLAMAGLGGLNLPLLSGVGLVFLTGTVFEGVSALARTGVLAGQVGLAARRITETSGERMDESGEGQCRPPETGDIVFNDVTFRWAAPDPVPGEDMVEGADRMAIARPPVLDRLDLTIHAGDHVALIGPSGVGKSSLAALLLKVAQPESGEISFGGHDIRTLDTAQLRGRIGWLSQTTHLFADTIRNNLTLGRGNIAEDRLWDVLEQAEIAEVVQELPDGLDSWVGEGGTRLSGGQGRRIALARTLLLDAPVMLLDEPATGLDSATERAFLHTLNRVMRGRTVILIAHRLTGAEKLDRAWRLEAGRTVPLPL
ncbi:amino acid ABC transporter ATP-binding/permease protein [Swaminathania salitolerans]|uniref:Cysteine/glutathione ABC transporter ATP-binding protein/permease CydC n=1 Tax=Swaminathania salitolerans TaxID=182838 RepID=A0A511BQB1_9PROT|nr:ATP-binding cassette domain-containing protein [Swaminathania salitolerans]GBQ15226.1 transport ATP-binding protein CydD [Swaminathania salitolerans LMG 21291]GEL02033.1 cysteine/glutathione ABC transporter ATP-binding protein/permease CydC [Swaminathania salitolerans]